MSKLLVALVTVGLVCAVAADIDGKWVGQFTGRDGTPRDATFAFKAEGGKLTGAMKGPVGREFQIQDGKISENDISFLVVIEFGERKMTSNYTGKLEGGELKMKSQREGAPRAMEFTLKKAKD